MAKLFVISDVHGFYDEMIDALYDAGFDENNQDHWLIGCGDYFDRGRKPREVMRYFRSLPRKVLVRGNHEQLLVDCCERGEAYMHDLSNGTAQTISDLSRTNYFPEDCDRTLRIVKPFLNEMVNYFETKHYIFVHSWIPSVSKDGLPAHYTRNRKFEFMPNWRDAHQREWNDAMWGNPFDMAEHGLNKTGKIICFGHWHSSTGWAKVEGRSEFGNDAKFDPFYGDGFISIDACTDHSGKCNVVVLEDDFLEE